MLEYHLSLSLKIHDETNMKESFLLDFLEDGGEVAKTDERLDGGAERRRTWLTFLQGELGEGSLSHLLIILEIILQ